MVRRSPRRTHIAGAPIDAVGLEQTVARIANWIARRERQYVVLTNAHSVVEMAEDETLRRISDEAGLAVPDGMPLVWIARLRGLRDAQKVTGAPLMDAVIAHGLRLGYRHYLYGGAPGLADRLARKLELRHPGVRIAGAYSPPFGDIDAARAAEDALRIDDCGSDLVWVGLGCPKQEHWMARVRPRLRCPVLVGVGAAFDFLGGTKPLAPRWVSGLGLEWLFRMASEPRRLWPRYRRTLPRFLALAARDALGSARHGSGSGGRSPPT